jgi:hypothetical protein
MTTINNIDFTSLFEGIEYNNNNSSQATIENQKGNLISTTTRQEVKHSFYSNITYVISGYKDNFDVWINTKTSYKMIYQFDNLMDAVNKVNDLRVI